MINGKPNPNQDVVAWRKVDDYTYEITNKLKGQTLVTRRSRAPKGSFSNIARMGCALPGSPRITSRTSLNNGAGGSANFLFVASVR